MFISIRETPDLVCKFFVNNIRKFFWSCKQRSQKYCSNANNSETFSSAH